MNEIPINIESKEGQEKVKILLHFFRHDDKEKAQKSDTEIRLTEAGRMHAKSQASEDTTLKKAVAYGSPRQRTQETAGFVMAGAQDNILGTESLEELNAKVNEDFGSGKKIRVSDKLDFILPKEGPYYDELMTAFKAGKLLKYLVEQSDKRAEELSVEPGVCSYSNQASQIAEIVERYMEAFPRYEKLVEEKTEVDEKLTMERFLASHQSVLESFLAKVIEQTKGKTERDAFVAAVNDQGFSFAEGFNVEIATDESGEEKAHITYKKEKDGQAIFEYDEFVSVELIQSLILN